VEIKIVLLFLLVIAITSRSQNDLEYNNYITGGGKERSRPEQT
jgi:hypothetical protein